MKTDFVRFLEKLLFFSLFLIVISCGNSAQETPQKDEKKPLESIVFQHKKVVEVAVEFKIEVENWKELQNLDSFLMKLQKSTSNEVLNNALETNDLVISLKDSVIPRKFNYPNLLTRINILNNETLRLKDMTYITSIKSEEVNHQMEKIFEAYSSFNSKINTILSHSKFENEIDVEVNFIGIDPKKIDETSKNSIDKVRRKQLK